MKLCEVLKETHVQQAIHIFFFFFFLILFSAGKQLGISFPGCKLNWGASSRQSLILPDLRQGYSYSNAIRMQSIDREFSSSSLRWLWRDTWRCRIPISVTYLMLKKKSHLYHYIWIREHKMLTEDYTFIRKQHRKPQALLRKTTC